MLTNIESSYIEEDVEVEILVVKNEDGVIEYIDIVGPCEMCDDLHIYTRFLPITDELLQDMIEENEECACCCGCDICKEVQLSFEIEVEDEEFDEDEVCNCEDCKEKRRKACKHPKNNYQYH